MKKVFNNLNIDYFQLPKGCTLEGGDFFVARSDLSILCVGFCSSIKSGYALMENDLLGTDKFALVIDEGDFSYERIHLDSFLNFISEEHVIVVDFDILSKQLEKKINRKVVVYSKNSKEINGIIDEKAYGSYKLVKQYDCIYQFLIEEKFKIIKISPDDQIDMMTNFLNLGNSVILSSNEKLEKVLLDNNVKANVKLINFREVEKLGGSIHCSTQVSRILNN